MKFVLALALAATLLTPLSAQDVAPAAPSFDDWLRDLIADELRAVRQKYADKRRTQIADAGQAEAPALTAADLAPQHDVWVTVLQSGLVSRSPAGKLPKLAAADAPLASVAANTRDLLYFITLKGRAAVKENWGMWATAFPDGKIEDVRFIDGGDAVAMHFVGHGKNDGPVGPLPATGKTIALPYCSVFAFDSKARIVEEDDYWDQLGFMVQLGHMQPPA